MDDKLMYIPNNNTQSFHVNRLLLVGETFGLDTQPSLLFTKYILPVCNISSWMVTQYGCVVIQSISVHKIANIFYIIHDRYHVSKKRFWESTRKSIKKIIKVNPLP